ncbi:MAG: type I glutamate--ammonia ligase [Patescibacteria group bacterium]|nr:type I glutamate--ammonia ligase [Patescibacteria group bacterium]
MIDAKSVFSLIKSGEIKFVDVRFTDLRGTWQHFTVSAKAFDTDAVERGLGFDGSSIRGFQQIYESDMLLKPDMDTCFMDPFHDKTLIVICDVFDPVTGKAFEKCPRAVARKAEAYLKKSGFGDVSYWGPEIEFFLFDTVNVRLTPMESGIELRSSEIQNQLLRDDDEEEHYKLTTKAGYFPAPPFDKLQDFRSEATSILESVGIDVEVHHHEVASAGQCEVDMKYDSLLSMADKIMKYKYVIRMLAKQYGMTAIFLPKPIFGDNGSGMHTHQSIFKGGKNVFFDPKGRYVKLSEGALSYAAGLLTHIYAVLGFTNSTLNSYRRLVPHFEAPTAVAFSARNRSAAIRIPMYFPDDEKAKRLEFRCPDPTANPYLALSAMLVAGLDGMKKKMDPTKLGFGPYDENIWEKGSVKQTPGDLFTSLQALEDCSIFVDSGVFSKEIIESYLEVKRTEAINVLQYPTPGDFHVYGDL